ncbi:MAG: 4-hydroxy-tetrahydrodipicolinate synthase [Leptospiraceae bacterium]|nr:4-hydroxy-tetrahydrodipicolinate synthase [Leptospiraceae bacterium]MCK6380088.1 4-hydroxy-tetrahydrodipicolinate synthase [Leptospiraceae bacterium]NUM40471.1 4-hydroxy-tetrahydrodipicolinate synthase [Leptospiraceae bacterium]
MFSGVFTAIVTPFKNDKIDYDSYFRLLQIQIDSGVSGVVPCGTTGESPTLNYEEHSELIKKTVEFINKRIQVIAGTGSNSTAEAIHLTRKAVEDGVDGVLSVNPYYNKPTQEGLFRHFSEIAKNSEKPVMLYNIPGRTSVNLLPETLERLSKEKNIVSVKEASGDLSQMARVIQVASPKMTVLSGDDSLTLPLLAIGGVGVVSVVSNLFPKSIQQMVGLFQSGKIGESRKIYFDLLPVFHFAFCETNPIPVKACLNWLGLISDEIRLPLTVLSNSKNSEELKKCIFSLKDKGFE